MHADLMLLYLLYLRLDYDFQKEAKWLGKIAINLIIVFL